MIHIPLRQRSTRVMPAGSSHNRISTDPRFSIDKVPLADSDSVDLVGFECSAAIKKCCGPAFVPVGAEHLCKVGLV